jgi:hypothetical protein
MPVNQMNSLIINETDIAPEVILDPQRSIFKIKGKSIPADGKEFFEPVLKWLDEYAKNPDPVTTFEFNLDFFNISSSKMLLFVLYKLNEIYSAGNEVNVLWYYKDEDDDMFEVGEDYAFMVDVPFTFLPLVQIRKETA